MLVCLTPGKFLSLPMRMQMNPQISMQRSQETGSLSRSPRSPLLLILSWLAWQGLHCQVQVLPFLTKPLYQEDARSLLWLTP